jgi:hydroxyethylthiazole kinase-like uncharacterized protein yjeF
MERAGRALAEAVLQYVGPRDTLILCGPGNNGGDGYVAARYLSGQGYRVRVAALVEPTAEAARWARAQWDGAVELFESAEPAPIIIDCLFGTGLKRGLEDSVSSRLSELSSQSLVSIACDLPSGVATDTGELLSPVPDYDLTVTFGSLKPAHRLMPAMQRMGRVVLADIGIEAATNWFEIDRPFLPPLDPAGYKYTRGLVLALAGEMPGAIKLAASAAAHTGAGYVQVGTSRSLDGIPSAIGQLDTPAVNDPRIGCLLVGPGMGAIPQLLTFALTSRAPKVLDADAISELGDPERLQGQDAVITPHAGEFLRLFGGEESERKHEQALAAAKRSGAVVVFKGPDTVVAAPDGRLGFAPPAPAWLATAGSGDVLSGMIAALRARRMEAFDAACAAVWLHGRAAEIAGPTMIADDLIEAIPLAIADL